MSQDTDELTTKFWFESAANVVQGDRNETIELNKPRMRPGFAESYIIIVVLFGITIILGTILNILQIYFIVKLKLYRDATYAYFLNMALADIIKCNVVIPFSLMMLLVQNWVLGEFFCYFLPMLQDVPANVTVLTLLVTVFDRYLFLRNPSKNRLPSFIFSTATWLTAIVIAVPYPIYTSYFDLGYDESYLEETMMFQDHVDLPSALGAGICIFGFEKDLKEYAHGVFIGMFLIPLSIVGYLFVQIFQILDEEDVPIVIEGTEVRLRASYRRHYNEHRFGRGLFSHQSSLRESSSRFEPKDQYEPDPRDEEKRVQYYLISIVTAYVACFGPLNVISKIIHLGTSETYDTTHFWDKIFTIFAWFGFLPTIITPILVFLLIANEDDKEIIRRYLRVTRREPHDNLELEESHFSNGGFLNRQSATTISTDIGINERSNSRNQIL